VKPCLVIALGLVAPAVTGCHEEDRLAYAWDDRTILCSNSVDDITADLNFGRVEDQFALAEERGWVSLIHAHNPGETINESTIDRILDAADAHHLSYVTYDELRPDGPGGPGVAFAFDDDHVDEWYALRDTFAAHNARITFFVTRWYQLPPDALAKLAELAGDGHDLEPHSHDHVDATEFVHEHSLDDYLQEQVLPSIQIMIDAGYHPTTFAFPFGSTIPAISDALLQYVDRVRTTPGPCPY